MSLVPKPYNFSAGATIIATEHNANFDDIYDDYNGNITNANISASAAIADSKLAQITTGSKVSGSSLILLPNTPSGAGELPQVNVEDFTDAGKVSGTALTGLASTPSGAGELPNANLAQLTTAGKVSATSLTGLASTPSGAGRLPYANIPTLVAFRANRGAAQSISNTTETKIQFNNAISNVGGYYDNTTNYRFTPGVEGYYFFTITCGYGAATSGSVIEVNIKQNGSSYVARNFSHASTSNNCVPTASTVVYMNGSTDYIEGYTWHSIGSAQNTTNGASCTLSGFLIGMSS